MKQFSVIIPTRNRPQQLANCLMSFTSLVYPIEAWELIVVNDGGDSSFLAVKDELKASLPLQMLTIEQAGPAAARNAGAMVAAGEILAFTDDDCRVTPDWLSSLATGFAETGCEAIAGRTLNPQPHRAGMQASQFLVEFLYRHQRDENGRLLTFVSNNVAIRRCVFEANNGFDTTFPLAAAEDMDLSLRLVCDGHCLAYFSSAQVWHHHQLDAWGHVKQQVRYGRGGYYFVQKKETYHDVTHVANDSFNRELWLALRQSDLQLKTRILVLFGQLAYRLGMVFERVRRLG